MKKLSEKILLYQVQVKHNPEAFGKLYDLYVKQLYRFVFFKIGNHEDAEDITAEVFLKTWNYLQEKKEIKSFSGLLYQIARNSIIDSLRSKSIQPEFLNADDQLLEIGDKKKWNEQIDSSLEAQSVVESLKKLKHEYREVITLRFIEGMGLNEISEITGKSAVSVRVTLHRALKKIKEILEKQNQNNKES